MFQIVEADLPDPSTDEVRVKILAAGVSFSEVLMRHGQHPSAPPLPFTPGFDMVGVVEQLGTAVTGVEVGQIVAALTVHGGYSQYISLPAKAVLCYKHKFSLPDAPLHLLCFEGKSQQRWKREKGTSQ